MSLKFTGTITEENITIDSTGLTAVTHDNYPVKMNANGQVALCSAEDKFIGIVKKIEGDDNINLQCGGVVELGYTGTAPGIGHVELVADGSGGVKTPTTPGTGIYYWILNDDATNDIVTFIIPS